MVLQAAHVWLLSLIPPLWTLPWSKDPINHIYRSGSRFHSLVWGVGSGAPASGPVRRTEVGVVRICVILS